VGGLLVGWLRNGGVLGCLVGWLVGWLVGGWVVWLVGGLKDGVVVCKSVDRCRIWLVVWVVAISKGGRFIGWEIGVVGWLVDRLVDRGQGGEVVGRLLD